MPKRERKDESSADVPVGPAWLPPEESLSATKWLNGRSLPAVWRDTLPFVVGGLHLSQRSFPNVKPGAAWSSKPEPRSDGDVEQAIAAKLHIGLRLQAVLAKAQLVVIDPDQAVLLPEWQDDEEIAGYANVAQLPASPVYLDFEGEDGQPTEWTAETWPFPFHLRGALCSTDSGLLCIVPFGSVGGRHLFGGTDYQAWTRWSFIQDDRQKWPTPGPGDFIASRDGRVVSWVDVDGREGESACAHLGHITFNLTTRVLRTLWALQTFAIPLEQPQLPRAERRRAKRADQEIGLVADGLPRARTDDPRPDETEDEPSHHTPCSVQNAHSRLNQAHILWHDALADYNDPDAFVTKINALIQTMRNITFGLQKDLGTDPAAKDWYAAWQQKMRSDPRMGWLNSARTQIVHKQELETHSKVRVSVVGELLRGTSIQLGIDSTAPVAEIARRLMVSGIKGRAAREGTLVVERRWVVDGLPDEELLDALAHCYGVFARIVEEAHDRTGISITDCEVSGGDPANGQNASIIQADGRDACGPIARPGPVVVTCRQAPR